MKKIYLLLAAITFAIVANAQTVATFEDLSLPADSFWNGSDLSGGFRDGGAFFNNAYDTTYLSWSGFSYSNKVDTTTPDYSNQYSAITGAGYNGSSNYVVADEYGNAKIRLLNGSKGDSVLGFYITNTTYAYRSIQNGTSFSKKFGGDTGNDPDWFKLTVKGMKAGSLVADTVDFYLADYRFSDNSQDYIVNTWQWVDLTPLGTIDSLQFFLSSSDVGQYGINTPVYFAMDNFTTNLHNAPPVISNQIYSITYEQDTLLNVLAGSFDTTGLPLTINIIGGPTIPGSVAYDSVVNGSSVGIFYMPEIGVVAQDFIVYSICDQVNTCDTATAFITVQGIAAAVKDINGNETSVYPNPFTSSFTVQYSQPVNRITVYNIQGQQVADMQYADGTEKAEINAAELPAGVYFVRLQSGKETSLTRIVKQ